MKNKYCAANAMHVKLDIICNIKHLQTLHYISESLIKHVSVFHKITTVLFINRHKELFC